MIPFLLKHLKARLPRVATLVEPHVDVLGKAVSFATIGFVNAAIDTAVFLAAYSALKASPAAVAALTRWTAACDCVSPQTAELVLPNALSWLVAVSCSYAMNSFFTFAAESGRQLRWKAYGTFLASGLLGAAANTIVLVAAARAMPIVLAKICAILGGFLVNFSMSHFVVFRRRPDAAHDTTRA